MIFKVSLFLFFRSINFTKWERKL